MVSVPLFLGVAALGVGPLLYRFFGRSLWALRGVEGFVLGAVGGLVLLHVVPRVMVAAGGWALLAFAVGFATPMVLHRLHGHAHDRKLEGWVAVLALVAIGTHAALDGAALARGEEALSLAIVLHRLPAGVFIWWLIRPTYGIRKGALALGLVALATIVGFFAMAGTSIEGAEFALFEALVGGALLHVVVDHGSVPQGYIHHGPTGNGAELAGAVTGGLLAVLLLHDHETGSLAAFFSRYVLSLRQIAPALLVGFLVAGLGAVWLPRPRRLTSPLDGLLFGQAQPICSCDVLPGFETLSKRDVPAKASLAFVTGTPALRPEALLLSVPLLGVGVTLLWGVGVAVIAAVLAYLGGKGGDGQAEPEPPQEDRAKKAIGHGFGAVPDNTLAWILAGVAVLAIAQGRGPLLDAPPILLVPLVALLATPIYFCASGATPLAAALLFAGGTPGSALALLLAGPTANGRVLRRVAALYGVRTGVITAAVITLFAALFGILLDLSRLGVAPSASPGTLSWVAVAGLGLVLFASLLRQGPRHFLLAMSPAHHHDDHEHDHHHHH